MCRAGTLESSAAGSPAQFAAERMAHDAIATDVEVFIATVIDSVATMEALMLTYRGRDSTWTVAQLAQRLYVDPARAEASLQQLMSHGLLQLEAEHYRYAPGDDELAALIPRVVQTYERQLIAVTNLIHSRVKSSITEFANAFRMRKDK